MTTQKSLSLISKIKEKPHAFYGTLILASLIFSFIALSGESKASNNKPKPLQRPESIDTHIPPGFVLIPIEVENYESLDLVLGQYGVVDLYKTSQNSREGAKLIVKAIKILRSPLNPQHFAVLSPSRQAEKVVNQGGAFYVVVQNPKNIGTHFVTKEKNRTRIIIDQ